MTKATSSRKGSRKSASATHDGRRRVVIDGVRPEVDGGRFAVKRCQGDDLTVVAHAFTDGHDQLRCRLRFRRQGERHWQETEMRLLFNDEWTADFHLPELGRYEYTVAAWVDHFESWRHDFARRIQPEDIALALQVGATLVLEAAGRAKGRDAKRLRRYAEGLVADEPLESRAALAVEDELRSLARAYPDRSLETLYGHHLEVVVDPLLARFSAWYEMFPRSCPSNNESHGGFQDCHERVRYAARMGFDVLYLPPIHPIGRINRKGPNNTLTPAPEDPGSPWAIGAEEGGHKSVHPELGTLEDFRAFVAYAAEQGLTVAMDIAFQCAPDHPYVKQHPDWFRWRPDGSVQYAENPPKKYEDIYPFDFECEDWRGLWNELLSVFRFWIEQGVRVFRVDNPHTKPFTFWEWVIGEIKREHPDTIFLAEAFTRPKIMHRLAKLGFTQSYNYFPWRNSKQELTEYLTELSQHGSREYFRPNLWPNTPDILPEPLQFGGRAAFMQRFVLAATLGASYGIYGPAFELLESRAREPGSEEYLDSEKYQVRHWDLHQDDGLQGLITRVNRIRRENPALQEDWSLRFHDVDNEQLLCFSKSSADGRNVILVVVNLDPNYVQSGWLTLPLADLDVEEARPFQVHDLLGNARYLWQGARNYVQIDPGSIPAHIFRIRHRVRSEREFDYYL